MNEKELEKKVLESAFSDYYNKKGAASQMAEEQNQYTSATSSNVPPSHSSFNPQDYEKQMLKETDPDLTIGTDFVTLPSKGVFYKNKISQIEVEYMTSKDEDILSSPSLIENGTVLDVLLKRKIKTPGIKPEDLLWGDKNAILIFLRASSYGYEYEVEVPHPRTGNRFKATIDLRELKHKTSNKLPDDMGEFSVELPMRKKMVKFKLLTSKEIDELLRRAEAEQHAYGSEILSLGSLRLKASITEISGNRNKDYIVRFVDAMPALDSLTIKKEIDKVTPDIDMKYEFLTPDGIKFKAPVTMGVDFFFPSL